MRWLAAVLLVFAVPAWGQARFDVLEQRGELLPWSAVGRLDTGQSFCTGTLIARDLVLTAAHCLHDEAGVAIPAERLRFRAGYARGTEIAARGVRRWAVAAGYDSQPGRQMTGQQIARDVALLQLDRDIHGAEADPFVVQDRAVTEDEVSVVSYGEGRSEVLSRERSCTLTRRFAGGVFAFDCDVTFGSSGAPVFARDNGRLRILSLISGMGVDAEGVRLAYGMELPAQVSALRSRLRREAALPQVTTGARRIQVGERGGTGARFVRP